MMNSESPPEEIERMARPVIGNLLRARFPERDSADEAFETSTPIPVVHVGLDDLRGGKGLDDAKRVAWRQLVRQGDHPVALSEVVIDPTNGPQVTQLNYGPLIESLASEFDRPGRSIDTFDGDVRFVQIPALYTWPLWYEGPKEN